jgi:hypothetical protein
MIIVFAFSSVISTSLITLLAIAAINIVVRRECAYLIEEKLNAMVEKQRFYAQLLQSDQFCQATHPELPNGTGAADIVWPGSYTSLLTTSSGDRRSRNLPFR